MPEWRYNIIKSDFTTISEDGFAFIDQETWRNEFNKPSIGWTKIIDKPDLIVLIWNSVGPYSALIAIAAIRS